MMNTEEVAIHSMISVIVMVEGFLLIQVWKYLNRKSTGHQTFLDEMNKDGILVFYPTIIINWLTWIKFGNNYNYYLAMSLVKISQFSQMMAVVQGIIFHITRYLYVFHFEFINSINEKTLKMITRSLITALPMICCLTEDRSRTLKMLNLIHSTIDDEMYSFTPVGSVIIRLTGIAILSFVQVRIVLYRRKHPISNDQKEDFNPKFVAFVCFLTIVHLTGVAMSLHVKMKIIAEIARIYIIYFDFLIVTVLLIYSNENMFAFTLNPIKKAYVLIFSLQTFGIRHATNRSTVAIDPEIIQSECPNPVNEIESTSIVQENVPQIIIVAPTSESP